MSRPDFDDDDQARSGVVPLDPDATIGPMAGEGEGRGPTGRETQVGGKPLPPVVSEDDDDLGDETIAPDDDVTLGPGDPVDNEATIGPEDDLRLANTYMPDEPARGADEDAEDFRLAQTYMAEGGASQEGPDAAEMTFMAPGGGLAPMSGSSDPGPDAPELTFMAPGGGGGGLAPMSGAGGAPASPEMTFMAGGSEGPGDAPDMTFMDPAAGGGGVSDATLLEPGAGGGASSPDMTFMDPAAPGGDAPDLTFMEAGGEGGGSSPDMTFMDAAPAEGGAPGQTAAHHQTRQDTVQDLGDTAPADDVTFVSMAGQTDVPAASTGGASRSASASGASGLSRSRSMGRSTSALRSQRYDAKRAEAEFRGEDMEELYDGTFRLLGELARGGMGVVYKALHVNLNEIRALKVMLAGAHASDDARRRFMFEAEAAARLKHPHILGVNHIGQVGDSLYFTMPFVKGAELKERKKELGREKLLEVMIKTCDAVAYAHQRGIIHRDLKPANIMMTQADEPMVMDFGLAKQIEEHDKEDQDLQDSELARTTEGSIMGTPYYMSPEQAQGKIHEVDTRTDVYALGVILYELWAKELPFKARSAAKILQMIVNEEPKRPREHDDTIDQDLEAIILKAIDKKPDQRYATAHDLKEDLERYRKGEVVTAQRATPVYRFKKWLKRNKAQVATGVAVAALVLFGAIALIYQSGEARREQERQAQQAIATATGSLSSFDERVAQVTLQVGALLMDAEGPLPQRKQQAQTLREASQSLRGQLEEATRPLGGYLESHPKAQTIQQGYDEHRRALQAGEQSLERILRAHASLEVANEALAGLRQLEPQAREALQVAVSAPVQSDAALPAAVEAASATLAEAKQSSGKPSSPEAYGAARQQLASKLERTRQGVFAALSAVPANAPEAKAARESLRAGEGLVRELDALSERTARNALARKLLEATRGLTAVLEGLPELKQRDDEARTQRVEAARLARDLVQRGLEADPSVEGLEAARKAANAAHARALLTMCAYRILHIELAERESFTPEARAALEQALEAQKLEREALRKRLTAEGTLKIKISSGKVKVRGASGVDPKVVMATMMKLGQLSRLATHRLMDDELEALRQQSLAETRKTLLELKQRQKEEKAAKKAAAEAEAQAKQAEASAEAEAKRRWEERPSQLLGGAASSARAGAGGSNAVAAPQAPAAPQEPEEFRLR